MRRLLLLGLSAILLVAGCARPVTNVAAAPGPSGAGASPQSPDDTDIDIAVLRHYFSNKSRTSFPGFDSPVVYVLDRVYVAGSDAIVTDNTVVRATISLADQQRVITALRDEATIRFTADKRDVTVNDHGCATVRDDGILVALTVPVRLPEETKLALSTFVACQGAEGLAYELQHDREGWTVTDSTTLWVS